MRPPCSPPSGPRSMIQSADLIMSRLCSMTRSDAPPSINLRNAVRSFCMSSKWRSVEDIQDTLVCLRGEMRGKLQALRLAAGKCRRGLPQAQVAQTHLFENSQLRSDLWNSRKKCQSLANRELQHLMNVLFPVAHFEHAAFKARPAAFFADQFDVRQELHFYRDDAFALACLAAAAGNVERKMSG